ncbi:glycosyltransferase family 2 protein [Chryseobacterium sp. YR221]|uniref:glycosyltransferase family 2 protein n=1 Tax=Chryseobacterium sp. YR221 TaxID=1500293 RepID=UPI0009D87D63|nr:glycosyltransferase family 2 protein [Chryseobacterium sp. YR221]SMC55191.1 Glycosyltransferase involved in cell wall bisynthesis [Chryseobacterium sp. YR221]
MKTSVALCTYNGEKYLKYQLDSILNQTVQIDEIIICDDGSTDSTISILNSYQEQYPGIFKIYTNENNLRSVKNFEKAISLCNNEFIFLSDQDDIWVDHKVKVHLDYFENHQNINVIATNGYCITDSGERKEMYSFWDLPAIAKSTDKNFSIKETLSKVTNIATGASMSLRKSFLKEIIPIPDSEGLHHDEWIAFIAAQKDSFVMLDEKLFYYRIHKHQQIGGVFFDKNERSLLFLKRTFGLIQDFKGLSKYIKRLTSSYKKNQLYLESQPHHHEIIKTNMKEIEKIYAEKVKLIKAEYPVRSQILFILDIFKNKRRF